MTSFGEQDAYLFREGTHTRLHDFLGAHLGEQDKSTGCFFSVWAPNAAEVSVTGDFNGWEADAAPMELDETTGIWSRFEPGIRDGNLYKYHVRSRLKGYRVDKSDPFGV